MPTLRILSPSGLAPWLVGPAPQLERRCRSHHPHGK